MGNLVFATCNSASSFFVVEKHVFGFGGRLFFFDPKGVSDNRKPFVLYCSDKVHAHTRGIVSFMSRTSEATHGFPDSLSKNAFDCSDHF